ncbi:RNA recognition motif containing proteindomain containing protein [Aphelenchoides avenae]|nr:RNA recognition motif containing proteindomain containing protein [Aphelenchus avenae]
MAEASISCAELRSNPPSFSSFSATAQKGCAISAGAPCATEEDDRVPSPARLDAARRGPVRVPGTVTNVALVAVVPVHHAARTAAAEHGTSAISCECAMLCHTPKFLEIRISTNPCRSRSPYSRGGRLPPPSRGGRFRDGRDNPQPCRCLGVFGMSLHTTERDLRKAFGAYGEIESVQIVYDRNSGRSRGFGFIYYESTRDAAKAKEHMREATIDGMRVRVDYSVTKVGTH